MSAIRCDRHALNFQELDKDEIKLETEGLCQKGICDRVKVAKLETPLFRHMRTLHCRTGWSVLLYITLHNADKGFHAENRSKRKTYMA